MMRRILGLSVVAAMLCVASSALAAPGISMRWQFCSGEGTGTADRTFACAVETEGVDYRYAPARLYAVALPAEVAERCVALASRLGLLLAGIDLIDGEDGEWYCLEANPSPAFSAFDRNGAIAGAVAELLR